MQQLKLCALEPRTITTWRLQIFHYYHKYCRGFSDECSLVEAGKKKRQMWCIRLWARGCCLVHFRPYMKNWRTPSEILLSLPEASRKIRYFKDNCRPTLFSPPKHSFEELCTGGKEDSSRNHSTIKSCQCAVVWKKCSIACNRLSSCLQ